MTVAAPKSIRLGFERDCVETPLNKINFPVPLPVGIKESVIYRQIRSSVKAIGLVEGGFKPEVQHLQPSKVRRCHHLVRPRPINNFSLKSASPLPV